MNENAMIDYLLVRIYLLYAIIAIVAIAFFTYIDKKTLSHLPKKERELKKSVYYYYYHCSFVAFGFFPELVLMHFAEFYKKNFVSISFILALLIVIFGFLAPKIHLRLFMKGDDG